MSRGGLRHPDDFYETPAWATDVIIPHLARPDSVLEPAAGAGAMKRRLNKAWPHVRVDGLELDADRAEDSASTCGDFLAHRWQRGTYDLVITNPPYSLAIEFVKHALTAVRPGGEVAMLLRLPFLEAAKRITFHRAHPSDIYVFTSRPSFGLNAKGKKGTDSAAYAWFVWGEGRGNRWQLLERPAKAAA